jgi:carbon monoxide dehydrogenase subunit G
MVMSTVYKEFIVEAPPQFVWDAVKDVGAAHTRLYQGYVTDTMFADGERTLTFANGVVSKEHVISVLDDKRRLASVSGAGTTRHYHAVWQVFPTGEEHRSKVLWVVDVLLEALFDTVKEMIDLGSSAMKQTLETSFLKES